MTTVTGTQIKSILPNCKNPNTIANAINEICPKYGITDKDDLRRFIAQAGHESGSFNITSENLNYSADGLRKIFPKYFPNSSLAAAYARQPVKIANRVYANRMGNGNEASGDGYKFRGAGFIQLTGKQNHLSFAKHVGMDEKEALEYIRTLKGAMESACLFWKNNNLSSVKDFTTLTKRINGGTNGLTDRKAIYDRARKYIA